MDNPNIMEEVAKQWLGIEMSHDVSKAASDLFWEAAKSMVKMLGVNPENPKIPTFTHIRRKLMEQYSPEISLDVAYKHQETQEIILLSDVRKISTDFRKPAYEPLYEIASVNVSWFNTILTIKK